MTNTHLIVLLNPQLHNGIGINSRYEIDICRYTDCLLLENAMDCKCSIADRYKIWMKTEYEYCKYFQFLGDSLKTNNNRINMINMQIYIKHFPSSSTTYMSSHMQSASSWIVDRNAECGRLGDCITLFKLTKASVSTTPILNKCNTFEWWFSARTNLDTIRTADHLGWCWKFNRYEIDQIR